jgi:hypothetical protein
VNPWKEKLGCEVNVCQATHCDAQRMEFCALRKAYLERVAYIKLLRDTTKINCLKDGYTKVLEGMEADE